MWSSGMWYVSEQPICYLPEPLIQHATALRNSSHMPCMALSADLASP